MKRLPSDKKKPEIKKGKTAVVKTNNKLIVQQLLFILGLTAVAFLPVLKGEFLNWDDNQYVYENAMIRSFANLSQLITEPLQGNHHPLTMLSLAFNYAVSEYNPWSYHLLNFILHLLNTFLVYRLALKLSKQNYLIAFATSLIFGVHPMHVESVAWVAERKDVLYSFFFLLGLNSYVKYLDTKLKSDYWFSILWLVLSLVSKPAAVVFPLAMLCIDLLFKRKISIELITEKIPHFVLALIMGLLTFHAQTTIGATETIAHFTLQNRFFFGCYSFMMYFLKFILPINQTPFYPYPSTTGALPIVYYLAPLFLIAVVVLCFKTFKKSSVVTFGFVFYLVNIMLIMQFFIVGRAIIAERYTYMPYFGLAFISAWMLETASHKFSFKAYYVIIPVGLILSVLTYIQATHWKNGESLWEYAIKVYPGSRVYHNRAVLYRKEGNYDKAIELYTEGLKYNDDVITDAIYANRANIYFDKKDYQRALVDYNQAIKLNNHDYQTFENRGAAYLMLKNYDLALSDFNKSVQIKPSNYNVHNKLGVLYFNTNRMNEAIIEYKKYLEGKPEDFETINTLGYCYLMIGNFNEAIKNFDVAIAKGNKGMFYLNRSFAYKGLNNLEQARKDALTAKQLGYTVSQDYLTKIGL